MSSLALMRWLESAPERYDAGMRVITLGRVDRLRTALADAAAAAPGAHVLEIGCGTGALTAQLLDRGARITAIDQNPELLEQARERLRDVPAERVELIERTASEIDALPEAGFDAVAASLSLSEMSRGERRFVLEQARKRLAKGGVLVIGDELRPRHLWARVAHAVLRAPQALVGWLLAGSLSHPIPYLEAELHEAGFQLRDEQRWLFEGLGVMVAEPAT
jgi:demethylmenaquinone methyltransferase/2-methoxy-6-polyprenyl-1,4-benzoquinol methylase